MLLMPMSIIFLYIMYPILQLSINNLAIVRRKITFILTGSATSNVVQCLSSRRLCNYLILYGISKSQVRNNLDFFRNVSSILLVDILKLYKRFCLFLKKLLMEIQFISSRGHVDLIKLNIKASNNV